MKPRRILPDGRAHAALAAFQAALGFAGRSRWSRARVDDESRGGWRRNAGLTLVELVIAITVLGILASAAIPVTKFEVKREKERQLRADLWEMRDAIDHYKDAADKNAFQIKVDSFGYPPDLQTLVDGVDIMTGKLKFLRAIPVDPMTGTADWDLRSNQDDSDASSWGGQAVFDVHSKSTGTALDGTKYNTW
jgi:general secretion pathway protein G